MTSILTDFISIFQKHHVEVILIGGWAAILHGSARSTIDVDFVYARSDENIRNLVSALSQLEPYLRDAPKGLPFTWDDQTIRAGLNFTLSTSLGAINLLGEVPGGGTYDELLPFCEPVEIEGIRLQCVSLGCLIQLKRAAGRPKDLEAIAELQAILDRREGDE